MFAIQNLLARPVVALALHEQLRNSLARPDRRAAPQAHASGPSPHRILIALDGQSLFDASLPHELGLVGHLARQVSQLTGRGCDLEILANGDMSAAECERALGGLDLTRFDAIVLFIGASEALALRSVAIWRPRLAELLSGIQSQGGPMCTPSSSRSHRWLRSSRCRGHWIA